MVCLNDKDNLMIADKHEKKDGLPGGDSVVPTLPEVKMCAAKAIARAAKNSETI